MPYVLGRRDGSGDDFISHLWRRAPEIFVSPWDEHAIYGNVKAQFEGGQSITAHAAANLVYLLLTTPVRDELSGSDPKPAANLVEEALRLFGGVAFRPRHAKEDVELAGEHVRAGDLVVTLNLCAGRAPDRYTCLASVDLHRQAPGDHVAFHVGPRACAGQALARAQLGEILRGVVERLPNVRLDEDAAPPVYQGGFQSRLGAAARPVRAEVWRMTAIGTGLDGRVAIVTGAGALRASDIRRSPLACAGDGRRGSPSARRCRCGRGSGR